MQGVSMEWLPCGGQHGRLAGREQPQGPACREETWGSMQGGNMHKEACKGQHASQCSHTYAGRPLALTIGKLSA